jgi:hypothetical protein
MFGWKQWDIHLAKFKGKQINILEVGVYKGDAMQKFAQVFLDSEPSSHYYGIDTWEGSPEYVGIDFKEIEKKTLEKKANSPSKARIHLIKQESTLALPMLLSKGIEFDIIFIDASHVAKDVLYDSVICMRLLKEKGVLIFDDYLWEKLEPGLFTPKPAIDSILEIYKDVIDILYVGYQVIIQKVLPKFNAKKTVRTVISGFSDLLNTFWKENSARIILELTHQKLPELQFSFRKREDMSLLEKKVRALPSEISIIYSTDYSEIKKDIETNIINKKIRDKSTVLYFETNVYAVRNIITSRKLFGDVIPANSTITFYPNILKELDSLEDYIRRTNNREFGRQTNKIIPVRYYNEDGKFDLNLVKKLLEVVNIYTKETGKAKRVVTVTKVSSFKDEHLEKNLLANLLMLNYSLLKNGILEMHIDSNLLFLNDYFILLSSMFKKVIISFVPYRLYGLVLTVTCLNFQGIPESVYDGILRRLALNKDMEIVSLFKNGPEVWIFQEPQIKTILKEYDENKDIILKNLDKFKILQTKRTLDDLYTYVLK